MGGRKAERLCDEAVQADAAAHRIKTALAVLRPEGGCSDRQCAQAQRRDAIALLTGQAWSKVWRFLQDQRTLQPLDWVHAQLDQVVADPLWCESFTHDHQHAHLAQMVVMAQRVCQRLRPEWQAVYARVDQMLSRVVWASRAVECLTRVVRMHQARHRHISQERLAFQ